MSYFNVKCVHMATSRTELLRNLMRQENCCFRDITQRNCTLSLFHPSTIVVEHIRTFRQEK